uniref:FYVE-type domain-containing protein n=1 Tax=Hyaloperonospora arabidopsidis (strain Emoy2) TaxID=559515 RepID=M4BGA9_HYAAE
MSRTAVNKTTGHAPSTLMLERMQEAASDLAILATTTQGWRFANERNGAMLYDMVGRKLPSNVTTARKFGRGAGHSSDYYLVRAVTTVHTDVAAMLDLLHSSTTDEFRLVMKQVFLQYFQNGVTLDKLTCTTPPPFAADPDAGAEGARRSYSDDDSYSVNWLTLKAQAKLGDVENHRDFTLVCYQDAFSRHDSGVLERVGRGTARARSSTSNFQPQSKLVGVHVLSSVNFQAVPELPIPECTDRLHFRNSGFVVEETSEPNVLRLSLLLSLLPTKATLKHARKYQRWLQTLASCVGNLSKVLRPEVTLHCLSRLTWKQSDHCFMCLKMFRTFRRCHHCRFCGESVCSTCSSMINMAGYEIYDGSGKTLAAGATGRLVSSQCEESSTAEYSRIGDVWQTTSGDETGASRSIAGTRNLREARGCNVCVSDLRHGLTTSAIVTMRQNTEPGNCSGENPNNYNGGNSLSAHAKNRLSASNDEDEVVSYDSSDDVIYERRLGSIATYIPSIDGIGTMVENDGPFTASSLGLNESIDEFMVTPEELQDKFPAVNEPAPLRFRTASDPDHLRRMRNVSDPDLPQQLKDKHSMVSMSTASSSFSRSSNDNASQYLRNTNLSAMSDEYSACDLSRDPDILALAGLKPRPSDDQYELALRQQPLMPCKMDREQLYVQEEAETAKSVEAVSTAQRHEREIAAIEETFPTSWPGNSTADARMCISSTSACGGLVVPQHGNFVRSDVLRYRSQTTAYSSWNPAATAPFPIKSQTSNCEAKHNTFASSGFLPALDHCNQESGSTCAAGSANGSEFHFRRMNSEPAVDSSDFDVSRMKSEPPNTPAAIEAAAVTAPTESTSYAVGTRQVQHLSTSSSSKALVATKARRGSVPLPMHHMNRLPASIPECCTASEESNRNDMILLPVQNKASADFIVFSDSIRESIFMRADDGQDLIPLEF